MIVRRLFLIVASGSLLLSSLPALAQSVMLKPKFETGQTFYVEYTNGAVQKVKGGFAGPDGMTVNLEQIEGMRCEVKSASAEGAVIEMTWDRVAQILDFAMMPTRFDSDVDDPSDVSNQAAVALGPKLGMSVTLKLGPDGRVIECTGMEKVVAKLEEEALGVTLFEQARPTLTDENTASLWNAAIGVLYPNKEVKVGDTWTQRVPFLVPRMGEVTYVYNCKADSFVEEAGRKCLVVRYDGTVEVPDEMKTKPNEMGMILKKFDGKHDGVARYDIERGLITFHHSDQTLDMAMGFPGQESTSQPAEDPNLVDVTIAMNTDVILCSIPDREKMKAENAAKAAAQSDDDGEE